MDLYLIHWPVSQIPEGEPKLAGDPEVEETPLWETFEAMNELVSAVCLFLSLSIIFQINLVIQGSCQGNWSLKFQ